MAEAEAEQPVKKKRGKLKLILIGVVAVAALGGGGAAAGMYLGGSRAKAGVEDPNRPKLVQRADALPVTSPWKGAGPDPRRYQASYYTIAEPFTANLRDSDGFVQLGVGMSTFYDSRVLDRVKADEMPIRSAVLMTLGEQDPVAIATAAGKRALQAQLKTAINDVLVQREGFGGVDAVFFTSFVIQ